MVEPSGGRSLEKETDRDSIYKFEGGEAKRKERKESKSSFNSKSFDTCLRRNLYDSAFCHGIVVLSKRLSYSCNFNTFGSRNKFLETIS